MGANDRVRDVFEMLNEVVAESPVEYDLFVVFGSYGRGYPHEDSDLDLYVVTDSIPEGRIQPASPSTVGLEWRESLPEPDITAIQPRAFVTRYYDDEPFVETVLEEGQFLVGAPRDVREKVGYDPIADEFK